MPFIPVSPTFNRQEITQSITTNGQTTTITVGVVIETAQEITLTQDTEALKRDNSLLVSATQDLYVYGDVVRIEGPLSLPGRNVVLVVRRLILENDTTGRPPSIVVDGAELEASERRPAAVEKGVTPEGCPRRKKKEGEPGPPGESKRVWPIYLDSDRHVPGGPGWSAKDHTDAMHGEPGRNGTPGKRAGNVKILSDTVSQFQSLFEYLVLALKGKPRPDDPLAEIPSGALRFTALEPGEQMADKGRNAVAVALEGNSLRLRVFDCTGKMVADKTESEFTSGSILSNLKQRFMPLLAEVLECGGWITAEQAATMPAAQQREALIAQLSRITGLPPVFFKNLDDFALIGRGAVIAFLLQTNIRDEAGLKVEVNGYRRILIGEIAQRTGQNQQALEALGNQHLVRQALDTFVPKGRLTPLRDCLLFTLADALQAAGWQTPDQLSEMSTQEQRQALIDQLSRIAGVPKEFVGLLDDYELIGRGAATAVLLQMGVPEAELKPDLTSYRKKLIGVIRGALDYSLPDLRALDDQQLILLALKPHAKNKFDICGAMGFLRQQCYGTMSLADVLQAGRWLTKDQVAALPVAGRRQALIDQLNRFTGVSKDELDRLGDYALIGRGAAIVFMFQAFGDAEPDPDRYRKKLVDWVDTRTTRDQPIDWYPEILRGMDDQAIVSLAVRLLPKGPLRNHLGPLLGRPDDPQRQIQFNAGDVLCSGKWITADQLARLSDRDQLRALVKELSRISALAEEAFSSLSEHDLIGRGAAFAFLLQMDVLKEEDMKVQERNSYRNPLVALAARSTGGEGRTLETLDDHALVSLVLEHTPQNTLAAKPGMKLLRDRLSGSISRVLQAGGWLSSDQLSKMSAEQQAQYLIDQLSRIYALPKECFEQAGERELAAEGAVTALLLQMRIRDEASLRVRTDDDRNTLIVELAGKAGFDGLQGVDNQQLVRLALNRAEGNWVLVPQLRALRDRLRDPAASLSEKEREEIIAGLPLVFGLAASPQFSISAKGGAGGEGQPGQPGADGGPGGPGFDGHGDHRWATNGGDGGTGGNGGKGGDGGPGGSGGSILMYVMKGQKTPLTNVKGGKAGVAGQGGAPGARGKPGRGGYYTDYADTPGHPVMRFQMPEGKRGDPGEKGPEGGKVSDGADGTAPVIDRKVAPEDLLANMHVSQLVMMWQRLRAEYVATDPLSDPAAVADLAERLDWVASLLKQVPKTSIDFPLAVNVLPSLVSAKANALAGLNYFGFGPYDVPSVSVGTYRGYLDDALKILEDLEQQSDKYFAALNQQTEALAAFDLARAQASKQQGALDSYRDELRGSIEAQLKEIDSAEGNRTTDRKKLEKELENYSQGIKETFHLEPATLLNCLSQLSFVSLEHAVGGALMVASQAGTVINEGANTVVSDSGELVRKGYLLENIRAFDSPDLAVDFEREAGGFLSDSQSYRTIASYDRLKKLLAGFATTTSGAMEVAYHIRDHIELILDRNRKIDYYNALLRELVETESERKRLQTETQIAYDGTARKIPGQALMTNFVFGLCESVKTDCLEALHMLYRAQSFWMLSPLSQFHTAIGHSPEGITYTQLKNAKNGLTYKLVSDLNLQPKRPSAFQSVLVVLTPEQHPDIFENLKLWLEARFHLAPASKKSSGPHTTVTPTVAAFTGDTFPDERAPNPFYNMSNVRLTKVRAWMVGMITSNDIHAVSIEHKGREILWRPDNTPYPRRTLSYDSGDGIQVLKIDEVPEVVHGPIQKEFTYGSKTLKLDINAGSFQRGQLEGIPGAKDVFLDYLPTAELGLPGQTGYAAVGPFATWVLRVPASNPGLDLSKLSAIVMEFDGFSQGF